MDGIMEKLEEGLNLPVRLGIMRGFVSGFPGLSNSFYATAIGLVMHVLQNRGYDKSKNILQGSVVDRIVSHVKNIYEEYF